MTTTEKYLADARLQRELDRLEADGVELLAEERAQLAGAPPRARDAWLASLHRAAAARTVPRQVVRYTPPSARYQARKLSKAERKFRQASDEFFPWQQERLWRKSEDGLEFHHFFCGQWHGPFVDERQASDAAQAHDRTCREEARHV